MGLPDTEPRGQAMEIRTITRKQAGVIYANVKRGNIEMSREAVSAMYDFVGSVYVGCTSTASDVTEKVAALRNAIDAIFAGDLDAAQTGADHFAALC